MDGRTRILHVHREVILQTETTGFDPDTGDRIVELTALELVNHAPTENWFHTYINPDRSVPQSATNVHGLSDEFLSKKPMFVEIADGFLDFIEGANVVGHHLEFPLKFINAELARIGKGPIGGSTSIDLLPIARSSFPGQPASLEALCKRFSINAVLPDLPGSVIDAMTVEKVYRRLREHQ